MRLIDAHKVLDYIEANKDTVDIVDIVESIIMSPTVDAVPVIRCKDCRFYKTHSWNEEFRLCDFGMPKREDGFCSWAWTGKKKE